MESKVGNTVGFSVISKIILNNAVRNYQQLDYMELLSDNIRVEPNFQWDESNFSRMIHGKRPVFPKFIEYYQSKEGLEALAEAVEVLLDSIVDAPRLLKELETAVRCDGTISIQKREELLSGTDSEVIAKVLQFAIIRPEQNVKCQSPRIERQFIGASLPKRDKHFIGRQDELVSIDEHLKEDNVLFISGVPGIGKRSLAIQYGHVNRKRYTNQIFLRYRLSMKRTLTDLQCLEENTQENAEERFQRHLRLLNCLEEDSLLVILGMDCLPEKDESFELLYQLNCHLIITTELEMKEENRLVLGPVDDMEERLQLFEAYCPKRKLRDASEEDILFLMSLVSGHPYASKLLALTVKNGFVTVQELTEMILTQGLHAADEYSVEVKRDGKYQFDSITGLLSPLIQIQDLGKKEKCVLVNFTLMPLEGVKKARFGKWTGQIRALQNLIRLGWIQEDENGTLTMNALVWNVVSEKMQPNVDNCNHLLVQFAEECRRCKGEKAHELIPIISSICGHIGIADERFIPYCNQFGVFIARNINELTEEEIKLILPEKRETLEGRTEALYYRVIRLLAEVTGQIPETTAQNFIANFHGEDQLLFEELEQLSKEGDKKTALCLRRVCWTMLVSVLMGGNVERIIDLIKLTNEINQRHGLKIPHDNFYDYCALNALVINLYNVQERKREIMGLLEQKYKESVLIGDSTRYLNALKKLMEVVNNVECYQDLFWYCMAIVDFKTLILLMAKYMRRSETYMCNTIADS